MIRRVLLFLLLLWAHPLLAQDVTAADDAITAIGGGEREYAAIDAAFGPTLDADGRTALIRRAQDLTQAMSTNVATLSDQMTQVDTLAAQLGPAPPKGQTEAPDIAARRRQLAAVHSTLDSAIKRGRLVGTEATQLAGEIRDSAADAFNERFTAHTAAPLGPTFWRQFRELLPRDAAHAKAFFRTEGKAIRQGIRRGEAWPALLGLVIALSLIVPVRLFLAQVGRNFMIAHAPASRLRRSGLALWIALSGTVLPGVAALAFVYGLQASVMIAPAWERVATVLIRVAFVAGALLALGRALLQPKLPSWRLPSLSDRSAAALRPWVQGAAAVVLFTAMLAVLAAEAGSNGPFTIAADALCILLDLGLAVGVLLTVARLRLGAEKDAEACGRTAGGAAVGPAALLAWAVVSAAGVAAITGYFTLSLTLSRLLIWWPLLAGALYLLLVSVDDLCTEFVSRSSRMGRSLVHGFGVRASLIDQAGVALSALVRLVLVALALSLASGPFGSNVTSLLDIAARVSEGLTIGQITIAPGAILRALAVLAAGLFVMRLVQGWLTERYLPATELDAGARNSVAMVARYIGLILAALWALASLGIGVERIALLLSALSVGIGFGLQAITQNFVSGLILLAERPVKIGDWVRIGTDEGDVKRISVRATEIQIADKSTLIVPNSELITKAVLNKTLADPLGRIQLQFSVPLGADVGRARDMLHEIYSATPAILDDPKPLVFIDAIADGRVAFNSFAYVSSPREVYPTRSSLLFRLLADLPAAGIELGTVPQQMQIVGQPQGSPSGPQEAP
jgi:small-conductance mechanosensitive channel